MLNTKVPTYFVRGTESRSTAASDKVSRSLQIHETNIRSAAGPLQLCWAPPDDHLRQEEAPFVREGESASIRCDHPIADESSISALFVARQWTLYVRLG